jgi:hypothetical protein
MSQPHNKEQHATQSAFAERLSHVAKLDQALLEEAGRNTVALLEQVRNAYGDRAATFTCILAAHAPQHGRRGGGETPAFVSTGCLASLTSRQRGQGHTRNQALWSIHERRPIRSMAMLRPPCSCSGSLVRIGAPAAILRGPPAMKMAEAVAGELNARDLRGCASFLPAYPAGVPKLVVDMVNPHYNDYYGGKRPEAMDDEAPIPNYFPCREKGASFGFALVITRFAGQRRVTTRPFWTRRGHGLKARFRKRARGAQDRRRLRLVPSVGAAAPAAATDTTAAAKTALPGTACDALLAQYKGMLTTTDNFRVVIPEYAETGVGCRSAPRIRGAGPRNGAPQPEEGPPILAIFH